MFQIMIVEFLVSLGEFLSINTTPYVQANHNDRDTFWVEITHVGYKTMTIEEFWLVEATWRDEEYYTFEYLMVRDCSHCGEKHTYSEFYCQYGMNESEYYGV